MLRVFFFFSLTVLSFNTNAIETKSCGEYENQVNSSSGRKKADSLISLSAQTENLKKLESQIFESKLATDRAIAKIRRPAFVKLLSQDYTAAMASSRQDGAKGLQISAEYFKLNTYLSNRDCFQPVPADSSAVYLQGLKIRCRFANKEGSSGLPQTKLLSLPSNESADQLLGPADLREVATLESDFYCFEKQLFRVKEIISSNEIASESLKKMSVDAPAPSEERPELNHFSK